MRKSGFTFIEILVVMIIIGVIAAFGIPRLRNSLVKQNVRSSRAALATLVAKARAAAVQRGCRSAMHVTSGSNGKAWVTACKTVGAGLDTLGSVEQLAARYNITITAGRDSVQYDPRGLSIGFVPTVITFQSGSVKDSVIVNELGKVVH